MATTSRVSASTAACRAAVAVNLSGSVGAITNHTDAYIGSGRRINSSNAGAANSQSVLVAAGNDASFLGIATAFSFWRRPVVTPGSVVLVINNSTIASIDDGASVAAQGNVAVVAHSSGDVLTIAARRCRIRAAVLRGVGLVCRRERHDAGQHRRHRDDLRSRRPGNAGGNVLVDATDATEAYLITGAFAVGAGGRASAAQSASST